MSIGQRIRLARRTAALSLRGLAEKAGLSAQAISKYERDLDVPSSRALLRLAAGLGVKVEFFLRPSSEVTIVPAYHRKRSRLTRAEEDSIAARIQEWLERYVEIETLTPFGCCARPRFPEDLRYRVSRLEEIEDAAENLRMRWDLGLSPIENLMEVLEDHGIKVGLVDGYPDFDACTFWAGHDPVIVVRDDVPGDRQRFNLAHELGHIVLEVDEKESGVPALSAEAAAHRFAGAFLVPASVVKLELGEQRRNLGLLELHLLKHKYGLSMQAWVRRAQDTGVLSEAAAVRLFKTFRSRGWHKAEPGDQLPPEKPSRMRRLALRAVAEGIISHARASELLGISLSDFRKQIAEEHDGLPADLRH
ncbi:MAG: XRE family transcriptional regulator [Bacillota bacterium]|nr:XRE family transcriptional regulator [Bacillota bacterium]